MGHVFRIAQDSGRFWNSQCSPFPRVLGVHVHPDRLAACKEVRGIPWCSSGNTVRSSRDGLARRPAGFEMVVYRCRWPCLRCDVPSVAQNLEMAGGERARYSSSLFRGSEEDARETQTYPQGGRVEQRLLWLFPLVVRQERNPKESSCFDCRCYLSSCTCC